MFKNRTQNVQEKLFPDPYLKNQNWVGLWIYSLKFYTVFLNCMLICGLSKYSEIKLRKTCFYVKLFYKTKNGLELVSLPYFQHDFWRKIFLFVLFYQLTKLHCLVAFSSWDIEQYVYCNSFLTRLWRQKFWN